MTEKQLKIAAAAKIASEVMQELALMVAPGVTGKQLADKATDLLKKMGAEPSCLGYKGFPSSMCVSVNDVVVHGIPTDEPFKDGDLVSLDLVAHKDGYHGDLAVTVPVGNVSVRDHLLSKAIYDCLIAGIKAVKNNGSTFSITAATQKAAAEAGVNLFRHFTGHGIGKSMHEHPHVYNLDDLTNTYELLYSDGPYNAVCIEPMGTYAQADPVILPDGWTIKTASGAKAAHWEHTVLITEHGIIIPTAWPDDLFRSVFGFDQAKLVKE